MYYNLNGFALNGIFSQDFKILTHIVLNFLKFASSFENMARNIIGLINQLKCGSIIDYHKLSFNTRTLISLTKIKGFHTFIY
jgi:hypothetical protein